MDKQSKWTHITGSDDHPAYRKTNAQKDICRTCGQLIVLRSELDRKQAETAELVAANIEATGDTPEGAAEAVAEALDEAGPDIEALLEAAAEDEAAVADASVVVTTLNPRKVRTEKAAKPAKPKAEKPAKADKPVKEAPAHRVRWFATIDGTRAARTGAERGEAVRWDAECVHPKGKAFSTGEPKVFAKVRKEINAHLGK